MVTHHRPALTHGHSAASRPPMGAEQRKNVGDAAASSAVWAPLIKALLVVESQRVSPIGLIMTLCVVQGRGRSRAAQHRLGLKAQQANYYLRVSAASCGSWRGGRHLPVTDGRGEGVGRPGVVSGILTCVCVCGNEEEEEEEEDEDEEDEEKEEEDRKAIWRVFSSVLRLIVSLTVSPSSSPDAFCSVCVIAVRRRFISRILLPYRSVGAEGPPDPFLQPHVLSSSALAYNSSPTLRSSLKHCYTFLPQVTFRTVSFDGWNWGGRTRHDKQRREVEGSGGRRLGAA
ncbi:hypothetical protein O3P69_004279 [Scylla paramamosain]|uniref:Uncharacterized protein n=1 Tax=Scylla paramamosain TaxID=85552 RepID=A0AAW0UIV0_SCYPA